MSISRIPDPHFVFCTECTHRRKVKNLRRKQTTYYCDLKKHRLFGQAGCSEGSRRRRK